MLKFKKYWPQHLIQAVFFYLCLIALNFWQSGALSEGLIEASGIELIRGLLISFITTVVITILPIFYHIKCLDLLKDGKLSKIKVFLSLFIGNLVYLFLLILIGGHNMLDVFGIPLCLTACGYLLGRKYITINI